VISQIQTGFYNILKLWPETSSRATVYAVGDVVKATSYNSHSYKCTTAGTSHATTEPTWTTTNGNTTTDGTAVFTCFNSKTYQLKAPQGSSVPYVTFGLLTESPIGTFADFEKIEDINFWVNCFWGKRAANTSASTADIANMVDDVTNALDDKTLTVTGYSHMKCVRTFTGSVTWDADTDIFMQSLRYRIWLSKD
jgi:hypothetical protein